MTYKRWASDAGYAGSDSAGMFTGSNLRAKIQDHVGLAPSSLCGRLGVGRDHWQNIALVVFSLGDVFLFGAIVVLAALGYALALLQVAP